ncbi:MAG: hypothetical protein HKM06_09950 [Spirochaetales bacterium]|nr:hypothetical protein [Spirochaetales bacterium]
MSAMQLPFLVEGLLILIAGILGGFLGKKGQPYGKVKLAFHLFFFLWFSVGYYYIFQSVFSVTVAEGVKILVVVMGAALLTQLVIGVVMLVQKPKRAWTAFVHGGSALLMLLADLVLFVVTGRPS